MIDTQLSQAITTYIGFGVAKFPKEDGLRLLDAIGPAALAAVEPRIRAIIDELGQVKPDWSIHTLVSAGACAKDLMRQRHRELNEEALAALEWLFTWWWR